MLHTRRNWIGLTIVAAFLGLIWVVATRVRAEEINPTGRPPAPELGHPAPGFTLDTVDGDPVSLGDFEGTPVVLNFWATWCPPCRAEIPALEAAWQEWHDQVMILGVDVQEDPLIVSAFLAEFGVTYPVILDTQAEVARTYRVRAFPTTVLLDARGVVVRIVNGPINQARLHTMLDELVGP